METDVLVHLTTATAYVFMWVLFPMLAQLQAARRRAPVSEQKTAEHSVAVSLLAALLLAPFYLAVSSDLSDHFRSTAHSSSSWPEPVRAASNALRGLNDGLAQFSFILARDHADGLVVLGWFIFSATVGVSLAFWKGLKFTVPLPKVAFSSGLVGILVFVMPVLDYLLFPYPFDEDAEVTMWHGMFVLPLVIRTAATCVVMDAAVWVEQEEDAKPSPPQKRRSARLAARVPGK